MKKNNFKNSDFVHLHNHSEYSSFDGLSQISKMVKKVRDMGSTALALTDHGNVGGLVQFMKECVATKDKKGNDYGADPIKPIVGIEAYLSKNRHAKSIKEQPMGKKGNHHLVLLAQNYKGYQNISTLCSRGYTEGFYSSPRIDLELLAQHSEGVIASSACLSSFVNYNLLVGRYDQAKKAASLMKDIFKERFFLEVMYHGLNVEEIIIPNIFKLSKELDIPVYASNDNHYCDKTQGKSQEVFMAMSSGSRCINDTKHYKFPYHEFYIKDALEMGKIWYTKPEVIYNTVLVSEMIDSEDIFKNLFGKVRLPNFVPPKEFHDPTLSKFENNFAYMKHIAIKGLKDRGWDNSPKHLEAFEKELRDVRIAYESNDLDFATYFCVVWDYITWARQNDIEVGDGRGSGYASILLRCLKITDGPVDPIEYGLLWERFLGFSDIRFFKPSDIGLKKKTESYIESIENDYEDNSEEEIIEESI